MPVLLKEPVKLSAVPGVRISSCSAGIYKNSRDDISLIEMAEGSTCAGVFTKNAFSAAPVKLARAHLQKSISRYCLINALISLISNPGINISIHDSWLRLE
mgnify:CR=1 FL=1